MHAIREIFKNMRNLLLMCLFSALLAATSCATLDDPAAARAAHSRRMQEELTEAGAQYLSAPLTLKQCIRIAMEKSYTLRLAALQRRMSELDVAQSFSSFLPQISATVQWTTWSAQQTMQRSPIADKSYRELTYGGTMPLFMPATWLLYANRRLGMEQSALTAHIARQSVEYNITLLFYQCLVCEDEIAALKSQVEATQSQYSRLRQMYEEAQIRHWELTSAETQLQTRRLALATRQRNFTLTRARLLQAMGLSPAAADQLRLERGSDDAAPDAPEAEEKLILRALSTHPELSVADRQIVVAENDVRTAIANFLPVASGFLNGSWTSDTIADRTHNLYGGFSASMDLFKGFSKVVTYKSSKIAQRQAQLNRNSLFLSIMLEVISSRTALLDAVDAYELSRLNYSAMKERYEDYLKRYEEGLEPVHEMLDARSDMDAAEEELVASRCQRNVAAAMLRMSLGAMEPPADAQTPEDREFVPRRRAEDLLLGNPAADKP